VLTRKDRTEKKNHREGSHRPLIYPAQGDKEVKNGLALLLHVLHMRCPSCFHCSTSEKKRAKSSRLQILRKQP
jgi:hypothetical protein